MLRSSSASRVRALGRFTGRSATDIIGAVTSRMTTSTRLTSMSGVMLTLVMASGDSRRCFMSAPHHGDLYGSETLDLVEHAHELSVGHAVVAAHHHHAGGALG